jgi:2',3'-cyclic-nucleotide 2'-phosphodiesterase (5'-nucleotidase family)
MKELPEEVKDSSYLSNLQSLRALADEATVADPVVGQSFTVPAQRLGTYRRCKAGECETANLFNDAIKWYTGSDIAFQNSGGFRGPGWPAGDVRVSDIWNAMPFDNTLCTGIISGINLFKLFNYSVAWSTFEGENTETGGHLLQVSGLRVSYNLGLPKETRLVSLEIYDSDLQMYKPIERLGLYSFSTISFMCSGYADYPLLLGEETLQLPGEQPGEIGDGIIIQAVVADYLLQYQGIYNPGEPETRLVNRTDIIEPLSFIQSADTCQPGEFWQEEVFSCAPCPSQTSLTFLSNKLEFDSVNEQSIRLVNAELVRTSNYIY